MTLVDTSVGNRYGSQCGRTRNDPDAPATTVVTEKFANGEIAICRGCRCKIDALAGNSGHSDIVEDDSRRAQDIDAVDARARTVDDNIANDNMCRRVIDDDAICPGREYASSLPTCPINSDALGDCDCPKTTWVKYVDGPVGCSFGDCTRKGFARSRSAAGICVVSYPRHPRTRGLSMGCGRGQKKAADDDVNVGLAHRNLQLDICYHYSL